jgi:hypothetical protein
MGKRALVLGNGESRSSVDITQFSFNTLIGCNAAHRDISVDYLVCCDKRTVEEAIANNIKNIYSRANWAEKFAVNPLPELPYQGTDRADQPQHWGSGTYAVLLAVLLGHQTVDLLGFDLYSKNSKVNNIYKDTKNYAGSDSHAIDHSYWVYQLSMLFKLFPGIQFNVHNCSSWVMPKEWQKNNVTFVAL